MENKTVKEVVKKQVVDFKALAESVEDAFGKIDTVDVIADSNLPKGPKYTTLAEYRMVHFYKPGTEKDMFQLINNTKGAKFIVTAKVAEFLDKSIEFKPSNRYILVLTKAEDIVDTAKKIISAYQSIPAKEPKPKKKTEKAISEKKTTEKKSAEKKPAAKKNITAKRPAKKAVATA